MPALGQAAPDERGCELLDRLVSALQEQYGDDLDAVWLYGSRARGERTHEDSDIDVLVITSNRRDDEPLIPTLWRVLDGLGNPRIFVDPRQRVPRLGGRPARDWLLLHPRRRSRQDRALRPAVRPRSAELLERARQGVAAA